MSHGTLQECTQQEEIKKTQDMVMEENADLDEHRTAQQEQDLAREEHRVIQREHDKDIDCKLKDLSSQMSELIVLNKEVNEIKTAWRVGKRMGLGLAITMVTAGTITGSLIAIKNWLKN